MAKGLIKCRNYKWKLNLASVEMKNSELPEFFALFSCHFWWHNEYFIVNTFYRQWKTLYNPKKRDNIVEKYVANQSKCKIYNTNKCSDKYIFFKDVIKLTAATVPVNLMRFSVRHKSINPAVNKSNVAENSINEIRLFFFKENKIHFVLFLYAWLWTTYRPINQQVRK